MTLARRTHLVAVALCASLTGLAGASPAVAETGVEALDVRQVSDRLIQRTGRPSLVVLYATSCPLSRQVFPSLVSLTAEYRERGVDVFAFSVDKESTADRIPAFLASHGALQSGSGRGSRAL